MDERTVQNILAAIGSEFVPENIEPGAFGKAIDDALLNFRVFSDIGSDALWKARRKHQDKIVAAAKKLHDLLQADHGKWTTDRIEITFMYRDTSGRPDARHSLPRWQADLSRLIEIVKSGRKADDKSRKKKPHVADFFKSKHSRFEDLVGDYLSAVYLQHIGREPGISRGADGAPGGPFLRFVLAVLDSNAIREKSYTPESVATAFAKVRKQVDANV